MSTSSPNYPNPADAASMAELMTARFANMVMQNTNMALIFLGKAPNPQTGQTTCELEHAQYFIDQLEMLEAKTKGNLAKPEENLLRQSLMTLRMAFVEAAEKPEKTAAAAAPEADEQETPVNEPALPGEKTAPAPVPEASTSAKAESESHKKFSKKY